MTLTWLLAPICHWNAIKEIPDAIWANQQISIGLQAGHTSANSMSFQLRYFFLTHSKSWPCKLLQMWGTANALYYYFYFYFSMDQGRPGKVVEYQNIWNKPSNIPKIIPELVQNTKIKKNTVYLISKIGRDLKLIAPIYSIPKNPSPPWWILVSKELHTVQNQFPEHANL